MFMEKIDKADRELLRKIFDSIDTTGLTQEEIEGIACERLIGADPKRKEQFELWAAERSGDKPC
jgi:hypothetical protein